MNVSVMVQGVARQTNAQRSAATRQTLIDVAGELLVERGWAHVTSVAVCNRAGLTRGAFVHHFDSIGEIFVAVLQGRYDAIASLVESDGEPTTIAELVERTWAITGQPEFKVVLEAWLAGANDPDLGIMLNPVVSTFAKLIGPDRWLDLLTDEPARTFYLAAREAMLGLAWGNATSRGYALPHEPLVLNHLIATAKTHDARLGHEGGQP